MADLLEVKQCSTYIFINPSAGGLAPNALKTVRVVNFHELVIPATAVNWGSTERLSFPNWVFPFS